MKDHEMRRILKQVLKPGRYTGGEYGQVIKDKDKVKVEFGLVALAHNLRKYFKQITQREQKMMLAA